MFILFSGSGSNALIFGASVIQASTPAGTPVDHRLQKFFAIVLVATICVLQTLSRMNYIRFCNLFGLYKITFLTVLTVLGWCALASKRTSKATASGDPYGAINFHNSFKNIQSRPYAIALALLDIMRAYSGYEYANFVRIDGHSVPKDSALTLPRSSKKSGDRLEMRQESLDYLLSSPSSLSASTTSCSTSLW
jgi:amino acid transporter